MLPLGSFLGWGHTLGGGVKTTAVALFVISLDEDFFHWVGELARKSKSRKIAARKFGGL